MHVAILALNLCVCHSLRNSGGFRKFTHRKCILYIKAVNIFFTSTEREKDLNFIKLLPEITSASFGPVVCIFPIVTEVYKL